MAQNQTLTILSSLGPNDQWGIWVGGKFLTPPSGSANNVYWFVVTDRTNLNVVLNVFQSSNDTVPSAITQKYDSDQYLLYVVSLNLVTMNYPQGALFDFLISHGGGSQLRRLAQAVTDLNCGQMANVGYALVSLLGESDKGLDRCALWTNPPDPAPLFTLQLMPVDVDGTTYWTPITLPE